MNAYPWKHFVPDRLRHRRTQYALMGRDKILSSEELLTLYTDYHFRFSKKNRGKFTVFGVTSNYEYKWNTTTHPCYMTPCCGANWYYRETTLKGLNAGTVDRKAACSGCKSVFPYYAGLQACGVVQGFLLTWEDYKALREYVEMKYSPKKRQISLEGIPT